LAAAAGLAALSPASAQEYVWWEAEAPKDTNFPKSSWLDAGTDKERDVLSGGRLICFPDDKGRAGKFLEYEVEVPSDGDYKLYARKCWAYGPFQWRFDGGAWTPCGKDALQVESIEYKKFFPMTWVSLGSVSLKPGKHAFRIELADLPGSGGVACFDCFLLVKGAFVPNGKMKPGQKFNRAPEGFFPFEPDADAYGTSAIDLRALNEKVAGEKGWIAAKGDAFVHSKTGEPVRFWAVNGSVDKSAAPDFARFLAKKGVNLVRRHGSLCHADGDLSLDEKALDQLHAQVAALKKEGVYSLLSIYFPVWCHLKPESGVEGYSGQSPFALLYFDPKFQEKYRMWWREALTRKNPYTGLALKDDPAVAMVEIINEDSLFFWTFNDKAVPPVAMAKLEKLFGAWLSAKYGGLEGDKLPAEWKGHVDAAAGRARFRPLWEVANAREKRSQDTAEFLAVTQRDFYKATYDYLKKDLGYPGLVQASNWVTADARVLGPLDKWSNACCDYMDRHGYFEARHKGERAGFSIGAGDRYEDRSALLFEGDEKKADKSFALPIFDIAYNGKPSIISEINWNPPNRFRADMPLVSAAYGLLQGSDGFVFFATGEPAWQNNLSKFAIKTPSAFGQFPAAALIFRKGLVKTADPVAHIELKLADLFALKGAPLSQPQNLDEFRKKDIPPGKAMEAETVAQLDPLSFLAGRVEFNVTEAGGKSRVVELSKLVDRNAKTVRSATGELSWDYGKGLVTLNSPKAQGVTGFLAKAGAALLGDATITADFEYGSVVLVPLDDQPIAKSGKLLLQVMSEDTNYGWRTEGPADGPKVIADVGGPPLVVRKFAGTVTLSRPDAGKLRVTPLDFNGYPLKDAKPAAGAAKIELQPAVMYYLIER
jgi:hypothetical protein